ncbi:MAG TPA: hypothetical protein PLJ74_05435 [Myxococcota bacterium]|nr:hypothetical protein [Myxococcota bacterium]
MAYSTILQIGQAVAARLQLPQPATLIGNTDANVLLILAMINQTVQDLARDFAWPELQKEYTFTLATDTASYVLPTDIDLFQSETFWNRTQHWPLIGPIDAVLWQQYKSGIIASLPRQRIRVKGWTDKQMFFDPTPSSSENGQICVYEYISKTTFAPKTWVASTSWLGNGACSYNGNIYTRVGTGAATTGTTAPTVTSGSESDGSITWTFTNVPYDSTTVNNNDTDQVILDSRMIEDGTTWRFKQERGLDFEGLKADAMQQLDMAKSRLLGASVVNVSRTGNYPAMIGLWSYPEGNYNI